MADVSGGHHRSTTWSTVTDPKISSTFLAARSSHGQENSKTLTAFKSMRTIRQPVPERKAYPLPDPGQFLTTTATTAATPQSDASLDILYPMQSLKRDAEQEKVSHLNLHPDSGPMGEKEPAGSFSQAALKLPLPSPPPDKAPAVVRNLAEIVPEEGPEEVPVRKENKVVIVYDGEKKFTTAAVDVALREFAVAEGDAVEVVAFLEHIMSPSECPLLSSPFFEFLLQHNCKDFGSRVEWFQLQERTNERTNKRTNFRTRKKCLSLLNTCSTMLLQ